MIVGLLRDIVLITTLKNVKSGRPSAVIVRKEKNTAGFSTTAKRFLTEKKDFLKVLTLR